MIEIVHGSALDLGPGDYEDFDALITDPPYSPHVHENAVSAGTGGAGVRERDFGFGALTPQLRAALQTGAAHVRRWSCVFTDFEGAAEWIRGPLGLEYVRAVPWIRWSQPQMSGDRPCTGREEIIHFHRADGRKPIRKRWNGPGSLTHYARRCMRGQDKHPTEKPIDLMLDLVCYFTDPGEVVIDPCAGSGTTAVACRLLGRGCVAFEQDARWAAVATGRVAGVLSARDVERAKEWCESVHAEASAVPKPKAPDGSDVKTYERAQRRIADVCRVAEALP